MFPERNQFSTYHGALRLVLCQRSQATPPPHHPAIPAFTPRGHLSEGHFTEKTPGHTSPRQMMHRTSSRSTAQRLRAVMAPTFSRAPGKDIHRNRAQLSSKRFPYVVELPPIFSSRFKSCFVSPPSRDPLICNLLSTHLN